MRVGEPQPSQHSEPGAGQPAWLVPEEWHRAERVVWGAHGGAGTTTLATWLPPPGTWERHSRRCIRGTQPRWRLDGR